MAHLAPHLTLSPPLALAFPVQLKLMPTPPSSSLLMPTVSAARCLNERNRLRSSFEPRTGFPLHLSSPSPSPSPPPPLLLCPCTTPVSNSSGTRIRRLNSSGLNPPPCPRATHPASPQPPGAGGQGQHQRPQQMQRQGWWGPPLPLTLSLSLSLRPRLTPPNAATSGEAGASGEGQEAHLPHRFSSSSSSSGCSSSGAGCSEGTASSEAERKKGAGAGAGHASSASSLSASSHRHPMNPLPAFLPLPQGVLRPLLQPPPAPDAVADPRQRQQRSLAAADTPAPSWASLSLPLALPPPPPSSFLLLSTGTAPSSASAHNMPLLAAAGSLMEQEQGHGKQQHEQQKQQQQQQGESGEIGSSCSAGAPFHSLLPTPASPDLLNSSPSSSPYASHSPPTLLPLSEWDARGIILRAAMGTGWTTLTGLQGPSLQPHFPSPNPKRKGRGRKGPAARPGHKRGDFGTAPPAFPLAAGADAEAHVAPGAEGGATLPWGLVPLQGEQESEEEEQEEVSRSPRRTARVKFTCNRCGTRTLRAINPHAYGEGTVFVQCAGCLVYHKLVDNLKLFHELKGPCFLPPSLHPRGFGVHESVDVLGVEDALFPPSPYN